MTSAKIVAIYFPQLHAIPENDQWWGKGFTDWVNVKRGRPLFPGHYQPRIPLGHNYYDQSQERVIRWQVELAKAHGVHAFCHYHYWFDGKQLLETPTNVFLAAKDLDFQFCLSWANETWSRRWDGQDHYILQFQTHPPIKERWELHFQYLIKAWTDRRSLRIDGKPVFLIYRPEKIEELGNLFDYWQTRARAYGLPGLYFVGVHQHHAPPPRLLRHFDALMLFQPFVSLFSNCGLAAPRWKKLLWRGKSLRPQVAAPLYDPLMDRAIDRFSEPDIIDYDHIWRGIIAQHTNPEITIFPGAFVDWDNTARYRNRAILYRGATPQRFEYWMRRLLGAVTENRPEHRLIFVNAWNEWAEGAYLEPDERYGYQYLEGLRRAVCEEPMIQGRPSRHVGERPAELALHLRPDLPLLAARPDREEAG